MITNKNGITLIALIITIIIMIILAVVTIAIVINGGLFLQAEDATIETDIAATRETIETGAITVLMKKIYTRMSYYLK